MKAMITLLVIIATVVLLVVILGSMPPVLPAGTVTSKDMVHLYHDPPYCGEDVYWLEITSPDGKHYTAIKVDEKTWNAYEVGDEVPR